MERDIYEEDHEAFRDLVKDFVKRHVTGEAIEKWDAAGEVDRDTTAPRVRRASSACRSPRSSAARACCRTTASARS